ncbi:MAG TPA: class I mannose-6-phosphate isomerase [Allosphingosinicella sp.]
MTVEKLRPKTVEKIWGRRDLPEPFGPIPPEAEPVGEIWFEGSTDDALLVKYLFTSEKLSVQVHPDDAAARRRGLSGGKEEAWWVIAAEPDARVGLGLREAIDPQRLRSAALDGSIEHMLDWRPVRPGEAIYSPAGTIHAIGAGLSIVEIQQNADVTYRLFDYGRDRELHVDEAVAVAKAAPWEEPPSPYALAPGREILAHGRAFVLERWIGPMSARLDAARPVWLVPLEGGGTISGNGFVAGEVWRAEGREELSLGEDAVVLAAYEGGRVRQELIPG